jgi:glycosyltransferase involved in cell wall biosynthesis
MTKLSVLVITLNEELRLPACLESVRFADQIVVVDSGSTDRTLEIARRFTDQVFHQDWLGMNGQKAFALSKTSGDWILNLDADEAAGPELRAEVKAIVSRADLKEVGFMIPRLTFYQGRWIRHGGWYPDRKLRLFRRASGRFAGVDPHDQVKVDGPVGELKGEILHWTYEDLAHQVAALSQYAWAEATAKQKAAERFRLHRLLLHPPGAFLRTYFLKQGFRDGFPGLLIAGMNGFYTFLKYARLWELERSARQGRGDPA